MAIIMSGRSTLSETQWKGSDGHYLFNVSLFSSRKTYIKNLM